MPDDDRRPLSVLHLIDPADPLAGPCVPALAADAMRTLHPDRPVRHNTLIVGSSRGERIAQRVGLPIEDRLPGNPSNPWRLISPFRNFLRAIGPVDLIHAWSLSLVHLASLAAPHQPRIVTLSTIPTCDADAHWLKALIQTDPNQSPHSGESSAQKRRSARLLPLAISNTVKRAWVEAGGIEPAHMHVVRPGLDFARLNRKGRATIRGEWGVNGDNSTVIAALAEPAHALDAALAAQHLVHNRLAGCDVVLVIPPGAQFPERASRTVRTTPYPTRIIVDERLLEPWSVLPACDIALITNTDSDSDKQDAERDRPRHRRLILEQWRSALARQRARRWARRASLHRASTSVLPMLWAAAAGRLIVGEASYAVSEIVEHGHSALLAKADDPCTLSDRIRQALHDGDSAWKLKDAARSEAFSFFSRSRFASDLATVYWQICTNDEVRVPDLEPTGGLRFSDRA